MAPKGAPQFTDCEATFLYIASTFQESSMQRWIAYASSVVVACLLFTASSAVHAQAPSKITAADGSARDRFGYAVAVGARLAVIGAPGDDSRGTLSGSAYVFAFTASGWTQQAKLTASDGAPNSGFGQQVAISGDTILIGAPSAVGNAAQSGAAYVFVRSGTSWTQQAKLAPSDGVAGDAFGSALSLSGDTAVLSSPYSDVFGADSGAAYVFTRSGAAWTQQRKVFPADGRSGDLFGSSVSINIDTLAVGAPEDDDNAIASGSVYVFARSGANWSQQQKLRPADGANGDLFGNAVAVERNTLLVGAPDNDGSGLAAGAAYVFARSGSTWSFQQKLIDPSAAAGDYFGNAVALLGELAVVGALLHDGAAVDSGAAYVYERTDSTWLQVRTLVAPDGAPNDNLGASVGFGGSFVILGAEQNDTRGLDAGAAYIALVPPVAVPSLPVGATLWLGALLLVLALGARLRRVRRAA